MSSANLRKNATDLEELITSHISAMTGMEEESEEYDRAARALKTLMEARKIEFEIENPDPAVSRKLNAEALKIETESSKIETEISKMTAETKKINAEAGKIEAEIEKMEVETKKIEAETRVIENPDPAMSRKLNAEALKIEIEVEKPWYRPSADQIAGVAASLLGIVAILSFEKVNVVTTKSLGFVPKIKI